MDNEKEVIDAEIEEKEQVEADLVNEEESVGIDTEYDPNVVLNTIMQSQDMEFRNVLMKLSTLNLASKAAVICLLFKVLNYVGIAAIIYSAYCIIYVLLHYNKIKNNENNVQNLFAKNGKTPTIKKIIWTNIVIVLLCIPLAVLSFWYYYVFQVS